MSERRPDETRDQYIARLREEAVTTPVYVVKTSPVTRDMRRGVKKSHAIILAKIAELTEGEPNAIREDALILLYLGEAPKDRQKMIDNFIEIINETNTPIVA